MVEEYFYGFTLEGLNAEHKWTSSGNEKIDEMAPPTANKLVLKRALLGSSAAKDEYNVVEVETLANTEMVKIPIVVLKIGEDRQVNLGDLEFSDMPVTFRLTQGKGPVHIMGQHLQQDEETGDVEFGDSDEDDEDVEEEEHVIKDDDEDEGQPKKKLKLAKNHNKKGKNKK